MILAKNQSVYFRPLRVEHVSLRLREYGTFSLLSKGRILPSFSPSCSKSISCCNRIMVLTRLFKALKILYKFHFTKSKPAIFTPEYSPTSYNDVTLLKWNWLRCLRLQRVWGFYSLIDWCLYCILVDCWNQAYKQI